MASPPNRVGAPPTRSHEAELRRVMLPMIRSVRETIRRGRIQTPADARALGVALRRQWGNARIAKLVEEIGTKAEAAASRPWSAIFRAAPKTAVADAWRLDARRKRAYDGRKLLGAWSKEATERITSVRDEIAEGLRRDVLAALEAGTPAEDLTAKWLRKGVPVEWGTAEGRLKVIAQHQIATLHAQVQSERARAVGVESFAWRTQQDDRVREEHAELEGTVHAYADPPAIGLPGTPINCRCWAESVVPDDLLLSLGIALS